MSKTEIIAELPKLTLDEHFEIRVTPEAVDALGVKAGGEVDVEVVGRAVVVRSVEEAQRSRHFMDSFESILHRRRKAYEKLAEGPES